MPIPAFTSDSLLPAGIHDCTLAEFEERFGQFQRSDQRCRLFERLQRFMREVAATGLVQWVIVDGSYVTEVDDPHDIDLVLMLPPSHDFDAVLRPFEYNAMSKISIRRQYGFDAIIVRVGTPHCDNAVEFFTRVRERKDLRKGVLRVTP